MRETLKELNAELAVLHESLERAEIIERQLPAYLREIEAERDEAIAERDQLRAQLETANNNARHYAARCVELEATISRLENRVDDRDIEVEDLRAHVADLRGALEEWLEWAGKETPVDHSERDAERTAWVRIFARIRAALARTPAQSLRRIKAEALRATASELENLREHIQEYIAPDDARDDIRRVCWNRAKDLRAEADRLEATNGQ